MTDVVLFAHERPAVARAVAPVLELRGYTMDAVRDGREALERLQQRRFAALVVDVALPGVPGYELAATAKRLAEQGGTGAAVVVLVASVYRRTAYKRRPQRLYGADDYVEVHHLGDDLPDKLDRLLGRPGHPHSPGERSAETRAASALREEGDRRMGGSDPRKLAGLIVADLVLYNGDRILAAGSGAQARSAVAEDLAVAREIFEQVLRAQGRADEDPIGEAFEALMEALGRAERVA